MGSTLGAGATNQVNVMNHPPRLPLRFLRWFCRPELLRYIEGDLLELHEENAQAKGATQANWMFAWEVVKLFRPAIIKSSRSITHIKPRIMLLNHLKIAFRVFKKEKFFTAVNVVGLASGIWCALLTYYWCADEYRFDRFHENGDRLYRVLMNLDVNGANYTDEGTAYPLGDALLEDFPEVAARTRYSQAEPVAVTIQEQLTEQQFAAADANFFTTFSLPLLEGDAATCLSDLKHVVISETLAQAYFKDQSPLGETITLHSGGYSLGFLVTGVFEDIPAHSSVSFDMMVHVDNLLALNEGMNTWGNTWFSTYLVVNDSFDQDEFTEKLKGYAKRKAGMEWYELMVQKYEDQYLYDHFENGQQAGGRIDNLVLFAIIAGFTLLIGCFNYVNLATARAMRRNKEVSIRKTIGADRWVLITQFLTESGVIIMVSAAMALGWTYLTLPSFSALTGKNLQIAFGDPHLYQLLCAIFGITLMVSGLYPAISLSRGSHLFSWRSFREQKSSSWIRKGLVTLQFGISILLISGTVIIYQQLSFIIQKDLGLDQESVMYLELDEQSNASYQEIKATLQNDPRVKLVSGSNHNLIGPIGYTGDVNWRLRPDGADYFIAVQDVDSEMLELLDITLERGTSFSADLHPDSTRYIINATMAAMSGFEDPIGESLSFWGKHGTIVGVAKDFHFSTLHEAIQPLVIRNVVNPEYVFVKSATGRAMEVFTALQEIHETFSQLPAKIHFLDQEIEARYTKEYTMQQLAYGFSGLALILCALGLIGLVSYSIERRTKEIAVRMVLGASLAQLGQLLFREYLWLMLIASVIGVPVLLKWAHDWLEKYPYRIAVSPLLVLFSLLGVLVLALLIMGSYMKKVRAYNPVDLLRDE